MRMRTSENTPSTTFVNRGPKEEGGRKASNNGAGHQVAVAPSVHREKGAYRFVGGCRRSCAPSCPVSWRGGRGRPSAELVGVKAEIWEVIEAVRSEALERTTGAVVFQGYNTLLKALDTERRIRETDELARQVEELALIVDMTKNKERRA